MLLGQRSTFSPQAYPAALFLRQSNRPESESLRTEVYGLHDDASPAVAPGSNNSRDLHHRDENTGKLHLQRRGLEGVRALGTVWMAQCAAHLIRFLWLLVPCT